MWLTLNLRAHRHRRSHPVFPNSSSCSFRGETFFLPACVCDDSEVFPLPQTLHELPLFLQTLLGVESKGEIVFFFFSFQIFLMKISAASLLRLWHRASLVESFFGFFFRLVENCKDSRGMSSASVIRHLAVWISDSFLWRNKGGDDNVFGPVRLVPGIY